MEELRLQQPTESFEAFMRVSAYDKRDPKQKALKVENLMEEHSTVPSYISLSIQPRIKCHDCPGKLYNAGEGQTLSNFSVHMKNSKHRKNVENRLRNEEMEE